MNVPLLAHNDVPRYFLYRDTVLYCKGTRKWKGDFCFSKFAIKLGRQDQ